MHSGIMNSDYGDRDHGRDAEINRVYLLNRTLNTENDFLRDEIDQLRRRFLEREGYRRHDERLVGLNEPGDRYRSLDELEHKYEALEAENRRLRVESSQKSPQKLRPLSDEADDEEVQRLRGEVKKLRDVIDKLSKSALSPNKSKSPSPMKQTYKEETQTRSKNRHDLYYDRSTPESRETIERQQTMYAGVTR